MPAANRLGSPIRPIFAVVVAALAALLQPVTGLASPQHSGGAARISVSRPSALPNDTRASDPDDVGLPARYRHGPSGTTPPVNSLPPVPTSLVAGCAYDWQPVYPNLQISGDTWLNSIAGTSRNDVWAVGAQVSGRWQTLIEHFDGVSWAVVPSPNQGAGNNDLYSVTAISPSDAWAVGFSRSTSTSVRDPLALHWDGNSWTASNPPRLGSGSNRMLAVTAGSSNNVWAVGYDRASAADDVPPDGDAWHWDGASWSGQVMVPGQPHVYFVADAVVYDGSSKLYVSGYTVPPYGQPFPGMWTQSLYVSGAWDEYIGGPNGGIFGLVRADFGGIWGPGTEIVNGVDRAAARDTGFSNYPPPGNLGSLNNDLYSGFQFSNQDRWAVGAAQTGTNSFQPLVEHLANGAWSIASNGTSNGELFGAAALTTTTAWAVGQAFNGTTYSQLIERACLATPPDSIGVSAPATTVAGTSASITVTPQRSGPMTSYAGAMHLSSSDPQAILPSNYQYTIGDMGSHSFNVSFKTAGPQTVTATDMDSGISGTSAPVIIAPAAMSSFAVLGPTTTSGPADLTVSAQDAFGNVTPTYSGTVHFTSTDVAASLPPDYAFVVGDAGVHKFPGGPGGAILRTKGYRTVTATDTGNGSLTGTTAPIWVGFTYYFTWYDRISSPGFQGDNVHVVNPGPTDATVTVSIPGCPAQPGSVTRNGGEQMFTCSSGFGGPVTIRSDQPLLASQRVQYYQSFNEVWAQPSTAASTSLYFTWYDRISSVGFQGDNVHVVNPGSVDSHVTVSIPGCIAQGATVAKSGGERMFTCAAGFGGPVTISADQPVLASQRVQYFQSFNEVWAQPATVASTALNFTWYDRISSIGFQGDNVHVVNPGGMDAQVTISIPGCPNQVRAVAHGGGEAVVGCATGFGGPVTITADQPVLASQRVQYFQSFNEVWAQPSQAASKSLYFTWYDRISSVGFQGDNVHVVNPGGTDAQVTVSIPGCSPQVKTVGHAGGEAVFVCASGFGGPVTISADQAVLASQRVQYFQSFNEVWAG